MVILLTVLADSTYNILIFVAEKIQHICVLLDVNFNDIVSFEQLGPECLISHVHIQLASLKWHWCCFLHSRERTLVYWMKSVINFKSSHANCISNAPTIFRCHVLEDSWKLTDTKKYPSSDPIWPIRYTWKTTVVLEFLQYHFEWHILNFTRHLSGVRAYDFPIGFIPYTIQF